MALDNRLMRARRTARAVRQSHRPLLAALVLGTAGLVGAPGSAGAVPPANDHYLASTVMRTPAGGFPTRWTATVDTTEATTQGDLFQPDRDGAPLGGGPPEPLLCGAATVGKTVWFDFTPPVDGGIEVSAQGFDTSIAVYRYDVRSSGLEKLLGCSATPGIGETFVVPHRVIAGRSYTVQVGGAGEGTAAAAGALQFGFQFFADRDGDSILDAQPDRCPDLPGVSSYGGCPPPLKPTVTYSYAPAGGGIKLTRLIVGGAPKGASIRVSAGGRTAKASGDGGPVKIGKLAGATVRNGGALLVRVTMPRSGEGQYRYGAVGAHYRYPVSSGRVGTRTERCTLPGSSKPRKSCRKP